MKVTTLDSYVKATGLVYGSLRPHLAAMKASARKRSKATIEVPEDLRDALVEVDAAQQRLQACATTQAVPEESVPRWACAMVDRYHPGTAVFEGDELGAAVRWFLAFVVAVETSVARGGHIALPRITSDSITSLRGGSLDPGLAPSRVSLQVVEDSRSFCAPLDIPNPWLWRFAPSSGGHLVLPMSNTQRPIEDPGGNVRELLTGGTVRLYLATWDLAMRAKDSDGSFAFDMAQLCDLFGRKLETNTVGGKQYTRVPKDTASELQRQLSVLRNILLYGVGDWQADPPQVLVQLYRNQPKKLEVYQHAPLAWRAVRHSFTQVPRAVLRLPADDVPLALGLANLWRAHISRILNEGDCAYRTRLKGLAIEVGEDIEAGARRHGVGYWPRFVERLHRVLDQGELGDLHVTGEGPDAYVNLEPSEELVRVYQPLADASVRRWAQRESQEKVAKTQKKIRKSNRGPAKPR